MISLLFLSKPSFHSALYMQCLSKVQSQCFFTQNVLQFIHREKHIYFLLHSTSVRTDKTATRRLLLFSFVTGKHRAACYQVKQDKLKKASGGWVAGNHIRRQFFVQDRHTHTHTWTHWHTLRTSSSATTTWQTCEENPEVCEIVN